jgi:hypothetical protein
MANLAHDDAITSLLEALTRRAFCHPESGARMIYKLV